MPPNKPVSQRFPLDSHRLQSQYKFSGMLTRCLTFVNMRTSSGIYKFHTFRIGGATHLYLSGTNKSEIKIMGKWNLSAYKSYIRPNLYAFTYTMYWFQIISNGL